MGGGKGGGGSNASDIQAQLAQQLFAETDPLRRALIGQADQFVGGDRTFDGSPTSRAFKETAEAQFVRARENIIGATPRGGALTSALSGLESDRASALAGGQAQFSERFGEQEIARAMTLATGSTGQALGGLGQAGFAQAGAAQAAATQSAGKAGALGTGAGAFAGLKAAGK